MLRACTFRTFCRSSAVCRPAIVMARRTSARSTRAPIIEEAASTAEAVATSPVKRAVKKRKLSTNAASPVVDGASTSHEVALPDETASTVKVEVTVENVDGVEVTETSVVKKKEKRAPRQKGPSLEDEVWPERHWNSKYAPPVRVLRHADVFGPLVEGSTSARTSVVQAERTILP